MSSLGIEEAMRSFTGMIGQDEAGAYLRDNDAERIYGDYQAAFPGEDVPFTQQQLEQWLRAEADQPPPRFQLRLPADLMIAMRDLSKQNDRSVNAEIIRACREYIERNTTRSGR